jgi:8-oxo-dGTP pyrophosphatase MutT (NUDIX family)
MQDESNVEAMRSVEASDLAKAGSASRGVDQQVRSILSGRVRREINDPSLTCAAVLIPLLCKQGEWHVLVTQRTQHVEHHKGQISFPGGACEPDDLDLGATALRELHEEVGVPPEAVDVLGALDDFVTITDFIVAPFVGIIPHPFTYHLNHCEVEAVIEVPLSFLRDPAHLRVEKREYRGALIDVLFWDFGPYTIWGATAHILKSLLDLLP